MKVRGLDEENYFETIKVTKAANQHSTCQFRQRVAEEKFPVYQNAIGKTISVELDSGRPIFFGEVAEVFIETTYHGGYAEVKAVSSSQKTDDNTATRIFQSPDKKFQEILNPERLSLKNCSVELDAKLAAETCREIILQAETNFDFVKRLAAWKGRRVWVRDTWQGQCGLKVAPTADDTTNKLLPEDIISLRIGRRGRLQTAELIARKYFELGRLLTLKDNPCKFLIVGLEVYHECGAERIRFDLEELTEPKPAATLETPLVKLKAKVTDITDKENLGQVRVQFDIEDKDAKKSWLAYRTPYSGIIFLPELGECVEVFYTCGECYAVSTLRTKSLDSEFQNVVDKFIGNNRKQRIFFREKSLEIKSAETSLFMDEKKIVLRVGENEITMDAQGITLKTGGNLVEQVGKDLSSKVGGNLTEQVGKDLSSKVGGNLTEQVGKDLSSKVGGNLTEQVGKDLSSKVGGLIALTASGTAKLKGSSIELG